jgi:hypothetical protein
MRRRRKSGAASLAQLAWDMGMLALEADEVVGLRMAKLLGGGAGAGKEAAAMVTEKVLAAWVAGAKLAAGGSKRAVVRHYRKKVRANRKRLGRNR